MVEIIINIIIIYSLLHLNILDYFYCLSLPTRPQSSLNYWPTSSPFYLIDHLLHSTIFLVFKKRVLHPIFHHCVFSWVLEYLRISASLCKFIAIL